MSLRISLQTHPTRCIQLVSRSHALLFSPGPETTAALHEGRPVAPKIAARFVPLEELDTAKSRVLCASAHGTLGVISVGRELFVCVITAASSVALVRPGEPIQRILAVDFCSHPRHGPSAFTAVSDALQIAWTMITSIITYTAMTNHMILWTWPPHLASERARSSIPALR